MPLGPEYGALQAAAPQSLDQATRMMGEIFEHLTAEPPSNISAFETLLSFDKKLDWAARNAAGQTLLMFAARDNNPNVAAMLLERISDPAAREAYAKLTDQNGKAVMHYAAEGNSADVIHILARAGADMNTPDGEGNSPLVLAKTQDAIVTLLRNGADSNVKLPQKSTVREQLKYMESTARATFAGENRARQQKRPDGLNCLNTRDGVMREVLDACASGIFPEVIIRPLIALGDEADARLLDEIMKKLPPVFKERYTGLVAGERERFSLLTEGMSQEAITAARDVFTGPGGGGHYR